MKAIIIGTINLDNTSVIEWQKSLESTFKTKFEVTQQDESITFTEVK